MRNKLVIAAILALLAVPLYAQTIRNTRISKLNDIVFVLTTCQDAEDHLGAAVGVIKIPATYVGADCSSISENITVIDHRAPANSDGAMFSVVGKGFESSSPIDDSAWSRTHYRFGRELNDDGTGAAASANEFVVSAHADIPSSVAATANYLKRAFACQVSQDDPSGALELDANCMGGTARIPATNSDGRVWLFGGIATIAAGGDGLLRGAELKLNNDGTDVTDFDAAKNKINLSLTTSGTNPVSAAVVMGSGGPGFNNGFIARGLVASTTPGFDVRESGTSNWRVRRNGSMRVGPTSQFITAHFSQTASLNYDLSAAGITCEDLDIGGFTGLASGNPVVVGIPVGLASTAGVVFSWWVKDSTNVTVRACDVTSGNPNPAAATVRADVWQH